MFKCMPFLACNRQVDSLDKRQCNLKDIPEDVARYARSLEELMLDSNHITELNKPLFRLVKLRRLLLSDNEIFKIPPAISSLQNLVDLDLSKNDISDIPENIKFCKNLRILNLGSNPITRLPASISQLRSLTHLGLSDVSLTQLPTDIGNLNNLRELELRENLLKNLPPSIAYLALLQRLDLGANELADLPAEIGQLNNLQELYVDTNDLGFLPREIGNLTMLQVLDVSENRLEAVPEELGDLIQLTDLTLSQNSLESLPHSIGRLKKLSICKVDKNRLIQLTPAIGSCTAMQELILTENLIYEFPSSIGNLKQMTNLNIDKNAISELPSTIGSCSSLGVLSARDNQLESLPMEIGKLEKLRVLDVSGNRLPYLPFTVGVLAELQALWLSENQSQPLLKLQTDQDPKTGIKVLTCYLLPQRDQAGNPAVVKDKNLSPDRGGDGGPVGGPNVHWVDEAIKDDEERRGVGNFRRQDTPHPKPGLGMTGHGGGVLNKHSQERVMDGHVIPHNEQDKDKKDGAVLDLSQRRRESQDLPQQQQQQQQQHQQQQPQLQYESQQQHQPHPPQQPQFRESTNGHAQAQAPPEQPQSPNKPVPLPRRTPSNSDLVVAAAAAAASTSSDNLTHHNISNNGGGGGGCTAAAKSVGFADDGQYPNGDDGNGNGNEEERSNRLQRKNTPHHLKHAKIGDPLTAESKLQQIMNNKAAASANTNNHASQQQKSNNNSKGPHMNGGERTTESSTTTIVNGGGSLSKSNSTTPSGLVSAYEEQTRPVSRLGGTLGLSIAGGVDSPPFNTDAPDDEGIFISKVTEGGPADRAGLKQGDRLLAVNGNSTVGVSHSLAVDYMKRAGDHVVMKIGRTVLKPSSMVTTNNNGGINTRSNQPLKTPTTTTTTNNAISSNNSSIGLPLSPPAFDGSMSSSQSPDTSFASASDAAAAETIATSVKQDMQNGPGFSIAGGKGSTPFRRNGDEGIFISYITPGGNAEREGQLKVGDRVLSINGTNMKGARHDQAVALLTSYENEVHLVVSRGAPNSTNTTNMMTPQSPTAAGATSSMSTIMNIPEPPLAQSSPMNTLKHSSNNDGIQEYATEVITLSKKNGPLGLTIVGGSDHSSQPFGGAANSSHPGVFVSKIMPGGNADRTGKVRVGDRILSVNGTDIQKAQHHDVVKLLQAAKNEVFLQIRHDPQPSGLADLHIQKRGSEPLGVNICGGVRSPPVNPLDRTDEGIFVEEVHSAGAAARDGRLRPGMRLLEVNDVSLLGCTQEEAAKTLKKAGASLKLVVCDGFDPQVLSTTTLLSPPLQTTNSPSPANTSYSSSNKSNDRQSIDAGGGGGVGGVFEDDLPPELKNMTPFVHHQQHQHHNNNSSKNSTNNSGVPTIAQQPPSISPSALRPSTLTTATKSSSREDKLNFLGLQAPQQEQPQQQEQHQPTPSTVSSLSSPETGGSPNPPAPPPIPPKQPRTLPPPVAPKPSNNRMVPSPIFGTNGEPNSTEEDNHHVADISDRLDSSDLVVDPRYQSRLPSATNTTTGKAATPTTPTTPGGSKPPEKLSFGSKLKRFQQEIEDQSDPTAVPTTSSSFITSSTSSTMTTTTNNNTVTASASRIPKPAPPAPPPKNIRLVSDSDMKRMREEEESKIFGSRSTPERPAVVRTKKAENRLLANAAEEDGKNTSTTLTNTAGLSPAEQRAYEAAKRAEWRAARLKSLESDALKAEQVLQKVMQTNNTHADIIEESPEDFPPPPPPLLSSDDTNNPNANGNNKTVSTRTETTEEVDPVTGDRIRKTVQTTRTLTTHQVESSTKQVVQIPEIDFIDDASSTKS